MVRRRIAGRPGSRIVVSIAGTFVLLRLLLAEENKPSPSAFRKYPPSEGLYPSEKEYIDWAEKHISWVIQVARNRSVRYKSVAMISGLSALAITLAVAVRAPSWVPALLGFLAAAGQYWHAVNHDREQAHLGHQQAVRFQKALRGFHAEAGELSGYRLHERFKEFRQEFERVKEEYGSEILKVRGQEPPRVETGSR